MSQRRQFDGSVLSR